MKTTTTKRITLATIKAFVRRHTGEVWICNHSDFDSSCDSVMECSSVWRLAAQTDATPNNLGLSGAWFVLGSHDYFESFEADGFTGFEISNSCGYFRLAIRDPEL